MAMAELELERNYHNLHENRRPMNNTKKGKKKETKMWDHHKWMISICGASCFIGNAIRFVHSWTRLMEMTATVLENAIQ